MARERKKSRTKTVPFGNIATETDPGWWEWEIGGRRWAYRDGGGLNLYAISGEGKDRMLTVTISAGSLKEAALFTEGFHAGAGHACIPASTAEEPRGEAPDIDLKTS
jgi:hypothetical protein